MAKTKKKRNTLLNRIDQENIAKNKGGFGIGYGATDRAKEITTAGFGDTAKTKPVDNSDNWTLSRVETENGALDLPMIKKPGEGRLYKIGDKYGPGKWVSLDEAKEYVRERTSGGTPAGTTLLNRETPIQQATESAERQTTLLNRTSQKAEPTESNLFAVPPDMKGTVYETAREKGYMMDSSGAIYDQDGNKLTWNSSKKRFEAVAG